MSNLQQLHVSDLFLLEILINICIFKKKVHESLEINQQVGQNHNTSAKQ